METATEPTAFETLTGGANLTVTKRDGTSETVKVLQVVVEDYPKLLAGLENEGAQIEIYCARPAGWAKTLTIESHDQVMQEGDRLNKAFFSRWAQRRLAKLEVLRPGMLDSVMDKVFQAQKPGSSPNTSSKSPSQPG